MYCEQFRSMPGHGQFSSRPIGCVDRREFCRINHHGRGTHCAEDISIVVRSLPKVSIVLRRHSMINLRWWELAVIAVTGAFHKNTDDLVSNDGLVFARRPAWTYACLWYLSIHQVAHSGLSKREV